MLGATERSGAVANTAPERTRRKKMSRKNARYFDKPDQLTKKEWDNILENVVGKTLINFSPKPAEISEEEWESILADVARMPLQEWNRQKEKWEYVCFRTRKELNNWLEQVGHPELIKKNKARSAGLSIK